jgi:hypothetical protein
MGAQGTTDPHASQQEKENVPSGGPQSQRGTGGSHRRRGWSVDVGGPVISRRGRAGAWARRLSRWGDVAQLVGFFSFT